METNVKDFDIEVDDDDIIEIIDNPIKTSFSGPLAEGGSKNHHVAPVFNIFNKPESISKQKKTSSSTAKYESPQRDHLVQDVSSSAKGKRRIDDNEEDRTSKKAKLDAVKLAQP
jgi:hypothetical protein